MYSEQYFENMPLWELRLLSLETGLSPKGDRRKSMSFIRGFVGRLFPFFQKLPTPLGNSLLPIEEVTEQLPDEPPVTFSPAFLEKYPPPSSPKVHHVDEDGQLLLLDFDTPADSNEPPDPDDFDSLADFYSAMAIWDAQHPEPDQLLGDLDSFCFWAPCPWEWYEPELPKVVGNSAEVTEVTELDPPVPRCPCAAVPLSQCDGNSAIIKLPDREVSRPCYRHLFTGGLFHPPP